MVLDDAALTLYYKRSGKALFVLFLLRSGGLLRSYLLTGNAPTGA